MDDTTGNDHEQKDANTEPIDHDEELNIAYAGHQRIEEMIDTVRYCLEGISLGFDRWDEEHVSGPGFYLAIVSGTSIEDYADPMGANQWPVEICGNIFGHIDDFYRAAATVSTSMDGAVVASIDGALLEQMVRIKDPSRQILAERSTTQIPYEDWMGSRHMNALDTSVRDDAVATITLSEENGRVTVFTDGDFTDYSREEIGGRWRARR